ncbi:MAG TPA: GspE/PulE family protein [Candidatus Paceibacterota bacterium]|nr:GspE/PulE family protein [Candidatus Paceibacterota bacterium]
MSDDQLLAQLQSQGLIDAATANRVKRDALIGDESAESAIWRTRLVPDERVAQAKSALLKVPYRKVDLATLDAKLLAMVPEETARNYGTIPLSFDQAGALLVIGMVWPDDLKAQDAVKFIARQNHWNLGVYLISYGDWQDALKKYSPYRNEIAKAVEALNVKEGTGMEKVVSLDAAGAGDEDAPIIRIVADTFREAVQSKASDIHIEPQEKSLRIRFRLDGDLHQVASLPGELSQPVASRVKVISNLKIDETRIPQDGRFRARIFDRDIDFRVASFPTPLGEKIAIRVLDPSSGLKKFDDLPFSEHNREIVKQALDKPFGMILVTGPTGSGKTTTLYAVLQRLNQEDVNIVSLEDPVEYFVGGINQSQVRPEIGYTFASGLRQILRQDPDVIMVGEIRDGETADLAVQAALTGHIVLSTLHTNNAAGVIPRLVDMKVEPFLIPVSLNLIVAQRLLGTLCPDCKKPEEAPGPVQEIIARALEGLPESIRSKYQPPYQIYHAKGCNTCKGRGILGRSQIHEMFRMTPEIEAIVNDNPTIQRVTEEAKKQGMVTMRQDGVVKALDGIFSMEDILRETEES